MEPRYSTEEPIRIQGAEPSLYNLLAIALARMTRLGVPYQERERFKSRVLTAFTYEISVQIIREYFAVELED